MNKDEFLENPLIKFLLDWAVEEVFNAPEQMPVISIESEMVTAVTNG